MVVVLLRVVMVAVVLMVVVVKVVILHIIVKRTLVLNLIFYRREMAPTILTQQQSSQQKFTGGRIRPMIGFH